MGRKNAVAFIVTSVCALLVTTSCSSTRVYYPSGRRVGHGPPPHAPAHGHRHKHIHGVELVFDSHLGLYVVVGHPEHYYCNGHFYRLSGGVWETSLRFNSGWTHTHGKPLPAGLRAKAYSRNTNNRVRVVAGAKTSSTDKSGNQTRVVTKKEESSGNSANNNSPGNGKGNNKSGAKGKAVARGKRK